MLIKPVGRWDEAKLVGKDCGTGVVRESLEIVIEAAWTYK